MYPETNKVLLKKDINEVAELCRSLEHQRDTLLHRILEWHSLSDAGLRLRCGEMTAQEIRTVRAVLHALLPNQQKEEQIQASSLAPLSKPKESQA